MITTGPIPSPSFPFNIIDHHNITHIMPATVSYIIYSLSKTRYGNIMKRKKHDGKTLNLLPSHEEIPVKGRFFLQSPLELNVP